MSQVRLDTFLTLRMHKSYLRGQKVVSADNRLLQRPGADRPLFNKNGL